MNCKHETFSAAKRCIVRAFNKQEDTIHTEKWQGMDISKMPEARTFELINYNFSVNLYAEDLEFYRKDIKPNLPWADDHFLERVCGEPINPGEQWAKWPWGNSANNFRGCIVNRSQSDWSYLAGIIDGEGSFSIRSCNGDKKYPRIKISQVDRPFIEELYNLFRVGTFREYSAPNNPLSNRQSYIWRISSMSEVKWIIEGCLPYLKLKKGRALECLELVKDSEDIVELVFNHNYMERYFPKYAGYKDKKDINKGVRFNYGDLKDLINLLRNEPHTRQAYLPIFFPEDTGAVHGGRVPCSLGYHFIRRGGTLHINYYLRSCEVYRHFRDDCYLTVRLLLWVLDELRKLDPSWNDVNPGVYSMYITSFHCFVNDMRLIDEL